MSEITQITNYEARLKALLPGQFQTGTNWGKLLAALAGSTAVIQEQENVVFSLWEQRSDLGNAEGAQLAQWGKLFGLPNQGWGDSAYRSRLLVWLQVLRSKGTPDELIRIIADMSGGNLGGVRYWDHPPASYSIQTTSAVYTSDPDLALDMARYVAKADPAGVGIGQVIIAPVGTPFLFGTVGANGFSSASTERGLLCVDAAAEAGV